VVRVPLRRGISELVEAIEHRIEVAGHEPTWRVTGGSFESALRFAREAYDDPVVVERRDRSLLWPRVTLVVTTDPVLAARAPALAELAHPRMPRQSPGAHDVEGDRPPDPVDVTGSALEVFFDHEPPGAPERVARVAPVLLVVLAALAVALAVLAFRYAA
jgi:hypothetical protein